MKLLLQLSFKQLIIIYVQLLSKINNDADINKNHSIVT